MKDEEYVFFSDSREKAITARSAHATRTHCGRGGKVRLPSDNLTKKELQKMNGEVKSYRLNDPLKWDEFKALPDDLKVCYIQALRKKYKVPDTHVRQMMGIGKDMFLREMARLNLSLGRSIPPRAKWDKEGFYAWANGVDVPATVPEEEPAEEPIQEPVIISEELETVAEDDLPFEEPDPFQGVLLDAIRAENDVLKMRIDELLKANEELMAHHESDRLVIDDLRLMCSEYERKARMLEAQMDVVRLIFGGAHNG